MDIKADLPSKTLNWFVIWRMALLRPTVTTFQQIANDPKASVKWGITWMAITSIVVWFTNPLRAFLDGPIENTFGMQAYSYFLVIGAVVSPIVGVVALLIAASVARVFAHLFGGTGNFYQLVYCWGVMSPPFIILSGLVSHIPAIFSSSRSFVYSRVGIIVQLISIALFACANLYQLYAEVIALSAIEKLVIWKSIGIILLLLIIVGVAISCLSFGFQIWVQGFGY